ncbi:MAG: amino acid ABC transporter ATP-binding protein [Verrucomicrobia bacterium]|nr:amino acid ABC transporter ATP-binding protein [Verrucomicrobiota bacterium]
MIQVQNVSYRYPRGTVALDDVSIDFTPEHIFAVLGESGSGKTTLLKCIGRFLRPQRGTIACDGMSIYDMPRAAFRIAIGIVFQQLYLFPHLTVLGNMTLALRKVLGRVLSEAETEARAMLERLGIDALADSYPAEISGGQAQRAAIARGLVLQPAYMLLDEPTSALDANTTDDFAAWLVELKASTHFVIVTHDILFARKVATQGVYLSEGRVVDTGRINQIIDHMHAGGLAGSAR